MDFCKKTFISVFMILAFMWTSVLASTHIPILLYHNVLEEYPVEDSIVTVTPNKFEEHLTTLLNRGYTPISFEDYLNWTNGATTLPKKPVIITFDDGYETNYTYAFPILKKYGAKATIFTVAKYVGKTPGNNPHFNWEQAKEMTDSGIISIQSHTYSHMDMLALTPFEAEREIRLSKYLIEKNLGIKCNILAFPYGYHNNSLIQSSKRAGYDLTVQVGNFGKNFDDYENRALVRITVYGSWSGGDLVNKITQYANR